jgi:hypothetical protein
MERWLLVSICILCIFPASVLATRASIDLNLSSSAVIGQNATFMLVIENNGTVNYTQNITLSFTENEFSFVNASVTENASNSTSVSWYNQSIDVGESFTSTVILLANATEFTTLTVSLDNGSQQLQDNTSVYVYPNSASPTLHIFALPTENGDAASVFISSKLMGASDLSQANLTLDFNGSILSYSESSHIPTSSSTHQLNWTQDFTSLEKTVFEVRFDTQASNSSVVVATLKNSSGSILQQENITVFVYPANTASSVTASAILGQKLGQVIFGYTPSNWSLLQNTSVLINDSVSSVH